MKEFLIRRKDRDFCVFHSSRYPAVLRPDSFVSEVINGWGEHRIRVENCEISFSFEDPGIQICFETGEISDETAEKIMVEICRKVAAEIDSPCYFIDL